MTYIKKVAELIKEELASHNDIEIERIEEIAEGERIFIYIDGVGNIRLDEYSMDVYVSHSMYVNFEKMEKVITLLIDLFNKKNVSLCVNHYFFKEKPNVTTIKEGVKEINETFAGFKNPKFFVDLEEKYHAETQQFFVTMSNYEVARYTNINAKKAFVYKLRKYEQQVINIAKQVANELEDHYFKIHQGYVTITYFGKPKYFFGVKYDGKEFKLMCKKQREERIFDLNDFAGVLHWIKN